MKRSRALIPVMVVACVAAAGAQTNRVPGLDVELAFLSAIEDEGHVGTYPNGTVGMTVSTTVCNKGTVEVPWMGPMNPNHPIIAFVVAREVDGRFEQISDRSFVKHGFFAVSGSLCDPCIPPSGGAGDFLGLGCSDTYGTSDNGDRLYLGPPQEVNPWLGTWDPECSYFDRGFPSASPPLDCDGQRSLTMVQVSAMTSIQNRIQVSDADLSVPGADYYFQAGYIVAGEFDSVRTNSFAHRPFSATWNGLSWNLTPTGTLEHGTILGRWAGAQVASNSNGAADGRVFVATRAESGPEFQTFRYALHNRDNVGGIDEVRIPMCPGARVKNLEFRDIDDDPGNDWAFEVYDDEIVFFDPTGGNPLAWNTIYNLSFETDALPGAADLTLGQAGLGPGSASFSISVEQAPVELYNVSEGVGCSLTSNPPTLFATGTPARATIGNTTFGLESHGNIPGEPNWLFFSENAATTNLDGCLFYLGGTIGVDVLNVRISQADPFGVVRYDVPIPNDPSLEGRVAIFQAIGRNPGGVAFGRFDFSNGLIVRAGNRIAACR